MQINTIIAYLDAMASDMPNAADRAVIGAAAEALYQAYNGTLPHPAPESPQTKLAKSLAVEALDFLADFAAEKFPAEPAAAIRHPADELDPVTDAMTVWAWQQDASALLGKINA